jgi:hypothetical protein
MKIGRLVASYWGDALKAAAFKPGHMRVKYTHV